MNATDILNDFAARPLASARYFLSEATADQLNAHPANHDNSIAWLLWHTGREMDVQVADLDGAEVWKSQGFDTRFNLGELGDTVGYGHTPEQARSIVINDVALLLDYLAACTDAFTAYISGLSESDLDEVIDENWDPPVTRGVRLVSIADDAAQHIGQAAYAFGQVK